jgi:cation diffusion facilitator family transporter
MKSKKSLAYIEGSVSIFINTILFGLKLWAGLVTGSVAIIADAWHTLSDSFTSLIVIIGTKLSTKPADREHPFGHGRVELVASIIIGVLMAVLGFNFLVESIQKLGSRETTEFGRFAIIVFIVSIVLKEAIAQFAVRTGKKTGSHMLVADGWHHRTDSVASALILVGIFFGNRFWWVDGVMGILVSLLMFYVTFDILKEGINPLLGENPDPGLIDSLQAIASEKAGRNLGIHHIHVHRYGDHREITFHIQFPGETNLNEAHHIATNIEIEIRKQMNIEATIHTEPSG